MRHLLLAILLILPLGLQAQTSEKEAITQTIQSQLSAFEAEDLAAAFDIAAPRIQAFFKKPEYFGMMVQQGYPMVWRPDQVTFLELIDQPGGLIQMVMIRDQQGALHFLGYEMVQIDGDWRINGVVTVKGPEA